PWRTGTYAYEPRSPPATPSWTRPSNGWRRTPARHRPSVTGGSPCTHPNAAPACRPDARTSAFVSLAHACRVLPAFLSAEERRRAKEITALDPVGALVSQSFAQAARESIGRLAGGAST